MFLTPQKYDALLATVNGVMYRLIRHNLAVQSSTIGRNFVPFYMNTGSPDALCPVRYYAHNFATASLPRQQDFELLLMWLIHGKNCWMRTTAQYNLDSIAKLFKMLVNDSTTHLCSTVVKILLRIDWAVTTGELSALANGAEVGLLHHLSANAPRGPLHLNWVQN